MIRFDLSDWDTATRESADSNPCGNESSPEGDEKSDPDQKIPNKPNQTKKIASLEAAVDGGSRQSNATDDKLEATWML